MEQVFALLVHFFKWTLVASLLSSIIALLILTLRALFKGKLQPKWYSWLWLILIIRLMLPWAPESSFSLFNLFPVISSEVGAKLHVTTVTPSTTPASLSPSISSAFTDTEPAIASQNTIPFWVTVASLLWLSGILTGGVHIYLTSRKISKQMKNSFPVDDSALLSLFEECKQNLKVRANIKLMTSSALTSPALYGLFRPRLVLPLELPAGFNRRDLRYIFYHELAHHRHRDIGVNWIITLVLLLHWFNPLLRYCYSCVREDQELASDSLALSRIGEHQSKDYGYTVIKVLQSNMQAPRLTGMANFISNKAQMVRRITMIRSFRKEKHPWFFVGFILVIMVAAVSLTNARIMAKPLELAVPVGWKTIQTGPETIYVPSGSFEEGEQVSISIVDYKGIDEAAHTVPQLELYYTSKDLESWLEGIRGYFLQSGIELEKITDSHAGPMLVQHNRNYIHLIAFHKGERPYAISLVGTGKYSNLDMIKKEGHYTIFQKIVSDVTGGHSS